jgi:O-antigen/teichoic acid export membrane protein
MTGYEVLISKAMWVSATFNILLNFFLVPSFGASGAAFSTAITLLAWHVYLFRLAKRGLGVSVLPFSGMKIR